MPLSSGTSKKARQKNIETELHAHPKMDPKQAVAIGYAKQRSNVAKKAHRKDGVRDDAVVRHLIADLRDSINTLTGAMGVGKTKDGGPGSGPHKGERVGVKKQATAPQQATAAVNPAAASKAATPAPVASAASSVRRAARGFL
jgi:hypothetical protein